MKRKSLLDEKNRKEIFYNVINSLLAGALVFLGTILDGELSWNGAMVALIASMIVMITKFKEYWDGEKADYCKCLANFI